MADVRKRQQGCKIPASFLSQTAFIVGMQYNHYTVNEMADHIQICLVVMDTTSRVESSVSINITSTGTARGKSVLYDLLIVN